MTGLYNLNFLTSIYKNANVAKRLENVINSTEIVRIAKESKLIERERNFDVVAFVCGLQDFNDRGSL